MNEDELIYRIRFEGDTTDISSLIDPNALQGLVDLGKEIETTKEQLDSYQKQVKLGFPLSEEDRKNVEQLKLKLNDLRKEYQENQKAIANNDKALNANANTYNGLVERNKALSQAMRELPLDDTTDALQRMQAEYNANNDVLKEFDASMGNHQRNVGNYGESVEGIGKIFRVLPGPIGETAERLTAWGGDLKDSIEQVGGMKGAIGGFVQSLSVMKKALISTGIGALVVAAGLIVAYWEDIKGLINGVTREQNKLIESQQQSVEEAKKKTSQLDLQENQLRLQGKSEKEILDLKVAQSKEEQTRLEALLLTQKQTLKIQIETAKRNKDILQGIIRFITLPLTSLLYAVDTIGQAVGKNFGLEGKFSGFLANLVFDPEQVAAEGQSTIDETEQTLLELQSKIAGYQLNLRELVKQGSEARTQIVKNEIDVQKNLAAIYAEQAEEFEKQNAALFDYENIKIGDSWKQFENNVKLFDIERDFQNEMTQQRIDAATKRGDLLKALELRMQQETFQLTARFMSAGLTQAEAYAKAKAQIELKYAKEVADTTSQIAQQNEDDRIGNMMKIAKAGTEIANSLFQENKKVAISTAIIDTLAAAVNVMRSPGNLFVKLAQSAAILAAGYANVRKIIATQPGSTSGGSSVPTANMGPAMPMGMIGSAFNPSQAMRFGPLTTGAAGSAAPFNARENQGITVYANVDRKGLAIAVREGERQIKTQQFTFAQ